MSSSLPLKKDAGPASAPRTKFFEIDAKGQQQQTPSGDSASALMPSSDGDGGDSRHQSLDDTESFSRSDDSLEKGASGRLNNTDLDNEDSVIDLQCRTPPEGGGSSLIGASSNFVNTVIGVGIIALSQTLLISGVYFGIILMVLCVVLTGYTSWLMIETGTKYKKGVVVSYGTLCRTTLGESAFYALSFMNFSMMLGVLLSYAIVFRQVMGNFISDIQGEQFQYDWALLLGVAVCVMLPLSLLKDMSKLSFTSTLSAVMVLGIVTLVCVRAPFYHTAMVKMTPDRMSAIEEPLDGDRAQFLCKYARMFTDGGEFQSVSTILEPQKIWDSTKQMKLHDNDLKTVYRAVTDGGHCTRGDVSTTEVQQIMDSTIPTHTHTAAGTTTVTVTGSISKAHANKLYTEWSLNEDEDFNVHAFAQPGAFVALGVFGSAFITQQVVFAIYNSLRERTLGQWQKVVVTSSSIITVFCLVLSVVGFFCFQYQSRGYVFTTMVPRFLGMRSDPATNVAQGLLLATIAFTYPMQLFSGRVSAIELFDQLCKSRGWSTARDHPSFVHYVVSVSMWLLSVLVGMFVDDMVYVFGMIGAIFASPMIYILPVLAHFGQQGGIVAAIRSPENNKGTRTFCWEVIMPMCVLAFGIIIVILSPIFTTTEKFGFTNFKG